MPSSNILKKEIKLPKLPKLPDSASISLTRALLIVYSLFCLAYFVNFWYELRRDDTGGNIQFFLGPLLIIFSLLLLFGLLQDIYAAVIICSKRIKAWEHSLIGSILATISLILPMYDNFEYYSVHNYFRALVIPVFWILLTIILFWRISKLRKE